MKSYGAKAKVYLIYEDSLEELAKIISQQLSIPSFYFDTESDEPHDKFGMCEVMGFELWLYKINNQGKYNYEFSFETSYCTEEVFNERMHDLSYWFSKYINDICKIESVVINQNN